MPGSSSPVRREPSETLLGLVAELASPPRAVELAWLSCLWDMVDAGEAAAVPLAGTAAGRLALSRGKGGDVTVELDRAAETAMLQVLAQAAPASCHVVSEEVGEVEGGSGTWRVLIDPVDGSLNAKRGLEPFGATVAVSGGASLRDVVVGVVADYARGHRAIAVAGCGTASTRRVEGIDSTGRVELILTEMGRPENAVFSFRDMGVLAGGGDYRVRQMGSLALSLANTALGVGDVLFCPAHARSVDIAAGLLLVSEAGGGAAAIDGSDLWAQPLDLARRSAFVAWRPGLAVETVDSLVSRARELWRGKHPSPDFIPSS